MEIDGYLDAALAAATADDAGDAVCWCAVAAGADPSKVCRQSRNDSTTLERFMANTSEYKQLNASSHHACLNLDDDS